MKQYFTAIIEDDPGYAGYLEQCLARYGAEHDCTFQIRSFSRAEAFLTDSRVVDDMVFMDVDLGEGWMDGLDAARALRERGSMAVLFFITNMPQYAPNGYEVDAIDYCVKPINYNSLAVKLYIEVKGHYLMFHTAREVIGSYGGLGDRERELQGREFARCSASALVNLRYVTGLHGDEIAIGTQRIKIGRSRKKEFLTRLNQYLGG